MKKKNEYLKTDKIIPVQIYLLYRTPHTRQYFMPTYFTRKWITSLVILNMTRLIHSTNKSTLS